MSLTSKIRTIVGLSAATLALLFSSGYGIGSNVKPYQIDRKSGIEVRAFHNTEKNIVLAAKDTKGERVGIEKIVLFENGKVLKRKKGRFITAPIKHKKGKHKYHAEITDLDGNKFRTKKMVVDLDPFDLFKFLNLGEIFGIKEHCQKKGYTPSLKQSNNHTSYDKNSLKLNFKESKIIIAGFNDKKINCARCHSAANIIKLVTRKLSRIERELIKIWDVNTKIFPSHIVYNPGPLSRITKEEKKWLKESFDSEQFVTKRKLAAVRRMLSCDTGAPGKLSPTGDFIAIDIGYPSIEELLLHELTHSLQYNMPVRLSPEGKEHVSSTIYVTEPFAHYLTILKDPSYTTNWIINEKIGINDPTVSQVEYFFGLLKTYGHYFDIKKEIDENLEKALRMMEQKLNPLMHYAFHQYSQNILTFDTLAIEARSHEFPVEVIIASRYNSIIKGVSDEKVKKGLKICYSTWEKSHIKIKEMTPALIDELSDSYLAGGKGTEELLTSNINDLEHIIKRELKQNEFDDKEVLKIYHEFLRQKFTNGNGDITYSPKPKKQLKVLDNKIWSSWCKFVHQNYKTDKEKIEPLTKCGDWAYMSKLLSGTRFEPEFGALMYERKRLLEQ